MTPGVGAVVLCALKTVIDGLLTWGNACDAVSSGRLHRFFLTGFFAGDCIGPEVDGQRFCFCIIRSGRTRADQNSKNNIQKNDLYYFHFNFPELFTIQEVGRFPADTSFSDWDRSICLWPCSGVRSLPDDDSGSAHKADPASGEPVRRAHNCCIGP